MVVERYRRCLRWAAVGLAAAAVGVPAAQASSPAPPTQGEGWSYSHDGPRSGPATTLPAFSVDGPRSGPASVELPSPVAASGPGFDWLHAGIGIAIGAAVGLIAVAAALLLSRRRRHLAGA